MTGKRNASKKRLADLDDAPEFTGAELDHPRGVWRIGGQVVSAVHGRDAMRQAMIGKSRVNIHLDNDIISYFKNQAGVKGYQTLINAALRNHIQGHNLEKIIERTISSQFERHVHQLQSIPQGAEFNVFSAGAGSNFYGKFLVGNDESPREATISTQANTAAPLIGPLTMTRGNA